MSGRRVVSVHRDVSQVDDAVFSAWEQCADGATIDLIFWNDYGLRRDQPDPELGLVPKFPAFAAESTAVRRLWLDNRLHGLRKLRRMILDLAPSLVILNDLGVPAKFALAAGLRSQGVITAFRSDKNHLSEGARAGFAHWLEKLAYNTGFDVFCPASKLALDYYGWPVRKAAVLFPYVTDIQKFSPPADGLVRQAVRDALGIPSDAGVLLCVAKFVEREGVDDVIRAYLELRERMDAVHLVVVGSGPLKEDFHALAAERAAGRDIHFGGYVPFDRLQEYFFAADAFVHLARREPWGVSVSDALCAGLGVVTTDMVGAGLELLRGPLAQYVTPAADPHAAAVALQKLFAGGAIGGEFSAARQVVAADYSAVSTARRLAAFGG